MEFSPSRLQYRVIANNLEIVFWGQGFLTEVEWHALAEGEILLKRLFLCLLKSKKKLENDLISFLEDGSLQAIVVYSFSTYNMRTQLVWNKEKW